MIFKRKIYNKIKDWKIRSNGTTALLVEGARRIGKTTILKEFAKNEYKSFILVDFSKLTTSIKSIFDNGINDFNRFFNDLSTTFNVNLFKRDSLIIFDEVQKFPKAREMIKHLVADGRYDYIETGSLISIRENVENILIPSEEEKIKMYPMDFEEFLWANNEFLLIENIKTCLSKRQPLNDGLHSKAMWLYSEYLIVGGMPNSISSYIDNDKDFEKSEYQKRNILSLYQDDLHKAKRKYSFKISELFENIPAYLSTHSKKVKLSSIGGGLTYEMFSESFFWLKSSMIVNLCYRTNDPNVTLALDKDLSSVKCYMADSGLLVSKSVINKINSSNVIYNSLLHNKLGINKGMIYENSIAQTLSCMNYDLYCYDNINKYNKKIDKSIIEIDFIIDVMVNNSYKILPIEVKSSKNYTTKSLDAFKQKFGKRTTNGLIIHPKKLEIKPNALCIPPYMFLFYLQELNKRH